jgi:flagellin-specific chaperone FliS
MNNAFKQYSLKIFQDLNEKVSKKFENLESKEIEKHINELSKFESIFNEIERNLDYSLNRMAELKINKEIAKELNFIN